ncbi:MAG: hypothetical protein QOH93_1642 [Chloroflexia bacterium]|jgi:broad-specificity NMP kinase|nr:hypothetical protein [Chloroflexia bacterium]
MEFESENTQVVVITGPVGVGKSAVAAELSDLLDAAGVAHAMVDMDWLRWCYPSPADDPFHTALGFQNLAAVWANYHVVGARRLILVDIVETRSAVDDYKAAVPGAEIQVVRLDATLATIRRRLEGRETGANLDWHRNRAAELKDLMQARAVEDFLVQTEGRTIAEVAAEILVKIGWESVVTFKFPSREA